MKIVMIGATTALVASLTACGIAPPLDIKNQDLISSQTTLQYDKYTKITMIEGPNAVQSNDRHSGAMTFLRAGKTNNEVDFIQLYVADYYYADWRFYQAAFDSNGAQLDFTSLDRKVVSCSGVSVCTHIEHMVIALTEEYLAQRSQEGIDIKIVGKTGSKVVTLTPEYVRAFLGKLQN